MKRHFDIRRYLYVMIPVAVVLYVLSTFVFAKTQVSAQSALTGLLLFVANAAAVYFTVEFFSLGINHTAPLLFASLALSFPAVALYESSYLCTPLVCGAFYLAVKYHGGEVSDDIAFFYCALIAAASMLFPPLAWLFPFVLAMNFAMAGDKVRYVVMSLMGMLLPLVVYLSYLYIATDVRNLLPAAGAYLRQIVTPAPSFGASSAARVIKVLIFAICYAVALGRFFRRSAEYSVSHSHVMIFIFSYTALMVLLLAMFPYAGRTTNTMLIMMPLSIVFYDYLVWGADDRQCRIALAFLALALVLEYAFVAVR